MILRLVLLCAAAASIAVAADNQVVAARLAKRAEQARKSGQLVRAYLLYAEAATRDPKHDSYALNRDGLAPLARLLTKANVSDADVDVKSDILAAEEDADQQPLDAVSEATAPGETADLESPPHLEPGTAVHDFDLRSDDKGTITQVAQAYGIQTVFDPDFDTKPIGRFKIEAVDFRTVMEGLTSVTHTFVFPLTGHSIFVARDTELKRNEYEPVISVTVPLPDAGDPKEVVEAANAVRGALNLRSVSWDDVARAVVIRDHVTAARAAAALLQSIVLPRAQVSLSVQILAIDSSRSYHYGLALPTSFQIFSFVHLGNFQTTFPDLSSAAGGIFAFGAGSSFFGLAIGGSTLFAQYTKSNSQILYDANVVVGNNQTATLHVGDKYPIPTSLYTGAQQGGGGIYNPIGEVTQEDLGILLKVVPHVSGDGDVSLDVDAQYKALSGATIDTVPAIAQRTLKSSVRLEEGQYAILAGLNEDDFSFTRSGLMGLSQIPALNEVLSENTRTRTGSNTLILIKPTITRLPMDSSVSPQFLLGARGGARVLL